MAQHLVIHRMDSRVIFHVSFPVTRLLMLTQTCYVNIDSHVSEDVSYATCILGKNVIT